MTYTTKDKVLAMIRDIDVQDSGTVITNAKLDVFIKQQTNYIDARIGKYYALPIDSDESLSLLELICTYKVAHMIKTVLEMNVQVSDQRQDVQTNLDRLAEDMLSKLLPDSKGNDPIGALPGAVVITIPVGPFGVTSGQARTPTFFKGGNNW